MNPLSNGLTTREHEVMILLGRGKTSKEIAIQLKISAATVGSHRKALCRKLNVHSTAELVHFATTLMGGDLSTAERNNSSTDQMWSTSNDGEHLRIQPPRKAAVES
jgi:DNA-binding CsgD family transcriptional regulator